MSDPESGTSFEGILVVECNIHFLLKQRIVSVIIEILPVIDITRADSGQFYEAREVIFVWLTSQQETVDTDIR